MVTDNAPFEPRARGPVPRGRDRRRAERRRLARPQADRRRGDRRRAGALAGLVAGALGLAAHGRLTSWQSPPRPGATVELPSQPFPIEVKPPEPASPYERFIAEAAALYDVSADLVRAVIQTESNFNPRAVSRAGARGLMQLTPVTLRELKVKIDPFNPRENILAGTKYLSMLLDRHDGNVPLALASYNAGPTAVRRHRGIPPYKETRGYVKKVTNLLEEAREATPEAATLAD
jgi:hypothetical protein